MVRASCATTPKSQPRSPKKQFVEFRMIEEVQMCLFGAMDTNMGTPTTADGMPSWMGPPLKHQTDLPSLTHQLTSMGAQVQQIFKHVQ